MPNNRLDWSVTDFSQQLLATTAVGGLFVAAYSACGQNWTLTGAPVGDWSAVASSADGSKLVATSFVFNTNGGIYVSSNSGASWTLTSAPFLDWGCVASSADGFRLVAGVGVNPGNGPIFISTNSGVTWNQTTAPVLNWLSIASSADGGKLVAASDGIYTSSDAGATWVQTTAPVRYWNGVAASADGTKLVAVPGLADPFSGSNRFVYVSTDSGTTWNPRVTPAPDFISWEAVASSAEGTKLVATGESNNGIYVSADSGDTWMRSDPGTNSSGVSIANSLASSADGTKLVEAVYYDGIYLSTNSGATWALMADTTREWSSVAASADGNKLVATVEGGGIYTWQSTPTPVLDIVTSSGQLDISWIVPSMSFNLQQISDPSLTNWVDVTTPPIMTNLHYHVVMPLPASNAYYRLASP